MSSGEVVSILLKDGVVRYAMQDSKNGDLTDPNVVEVDCHFIKVGIVSGSDSPANKKKLLDALADLPCFEMFLSGRLPNLSYIEADAVIGDQGLTLTLFALGEQWGLWHIMTPAKIGVDDFDLADKMAGDGMIIIHHKS